MKYVPKKTLKLTKWDFNQSISDNKLCGSKKNTQLLLNTYRKGQTMQVITVTVAFSMPTRKLVTIKVTFLRVCLFGAHLQFLIPVTVRDPSQVMSAIFGRDGRLLTKFLCLPDTLICLSRIYQARKGCLICMRRIDQSWKRCLICLSRIEQADRAT